MVLFVDEFKIPRSLRKTLRQRALRDPRRHRVPRTSWRPAPSRAAGQSGTWITPAVDRRVHARCIGAGYAHSVEAWRDGELVGGLYGVAIGRMFFGESMFARESRRVQGRAGAARRRCSGARSMPLIDCQQETAAPRARSARGRSRGASLRSWLSRLVHSAAAARHLGARRSGTGRANDDQAQRPAARGAAVLRDRAVSVQLPAGPGRALAGRDAQPPDRHAGLRRTGPAGLPAQRGLHLPSVLRPLPGLRPGPGRRSPTFRPNRTQRRTCAAARRVNGS